VSQKLRHAICGGVKGSRGGGGGGGVLLKDESQRRRTATTKRSSRQLLIRQLEYHVTRQVCLMNSRSTTANSPDFVFI